MEGSYYTIREAAKLLKVSPSLVYRLVEEGNIPHLRVASAIRIPTQALEDFIQNHMHGGVNVRKSARHK